MNDFFYEARGKEKLKELRTEGQRSQAANRADVPRPAHLPSVRKLIMGLLGILGILELLVR